MGGISVVNTSDGHALDGTFLLGDVTATVNALKNGDWVSAGLLGVADTLDVAATVSDPFGSLVAAGLGWVMDHLDPLKSWLDDLTGDAAAVDALAEKWTEVSTSLTHSATELRQLVATDLADMEGLSIKTYREFMAGLSETVDSLAEGAEGIASAIKYAAMLVEVVHGLVRDTLAQIGGAIASYAAELVLTLGAATPLVIEQAETRVASVSARIGTSVKDLVSSCHSLEELVNKLDGLVGDIRKALDALHEGAARGSHAAPWMHRSEHAATGATSHNSRSLKSIPDRVFSVGTKETPYNALTEGYVGEGNYYGSDEPEEPEEPEEP